MEADGAKERRRTASQDAMETHNVISKARFTSAAASVTHVTGGPPAVDLLCLEPGQKHTGAKGPCACYVIAGSVTVATGDDRRAVPTGGLATFEADKPHAIANTSDIRSLCLVIRPG